MIRGFGNASLVSMDSPEEILEIARFTRKAGLVSVLLTFQPRWSFRGRVSIVENMEFFFNCERVLGGVYMAVFGGDRMSGLVLDWISSSLLEGCSFVHLPDYDPVGLSEYLRFKNVLGDRVSLFVPPHFEKILSHYGKRALLTDQARLIPALRNCGVCEIVKIIRLCEEYGYGLEQEILLLGEVK